MTIVQVSIYPGFLPTEPERNPLIPLGIQLSDLPTYVKTLHQMHIHYPSLVLVPDTFVSSHSSSDAEKSLLIDCIEGEFEGVPIEPVKRKYWNETTASLSTDSKSLTATSTSTSRRKLSSHTEIRCVKRDHATCTFTGMSISVGLSRRSPW